jgi:hypothetical protein
VLVAVLVLTETRERAVTIVLIRFLVALGATEIKTGLIPDVIRFLARDRADRRCPARCPFRDSSGLTGVDRKRAVVRC